MTRAVMVPIVCSCAWTGSVQTRGTCPGCGANWTHRVEPHRMTKLRQVAARNPGESPVYIEPMMLRWMTDPAHRLLEPATGALLSPLPLVRGSILPYQLTVQGERVILQAQLAERSADLKREIVAESVARHADLPEDRGSPGYVPGDGPSDDRL